MADNPTRRQQSQRERRAREAQERVAGGQLQQNAPRARARPLHAGLIAAQLDVPVAGPSGTQPSYQPPARVTGHTGLMYDIHELSPNSRVRADEGLHSEEFTVDFSMRKDLEGVFYYAFQLKKPVSVRISDRANGPRIVNCTCTDFQAGSSPCVHIFVSQAINHRCTRMLIFYSGCTMVSIMFYQTAPDPLLRL